MEQPNVYYINLERNVERLRHIEGQLESAGLRDHAARVDAVDGTALSVADIPRGIVGRRGINHLNEPAGHRHGLDLTMGAVALGITLYRLWGRIVDSGQAALVLEDDALLAGSFGESLRQVLDQLPDGWHLAYLGATPGDGFSSTAFSSRLRIPRGQLNGTHGYLVSAAGAAALLRLCYPMEFQIDTHMYLAFPKLSVFLSVSPIVMLEHKFGTDIQQDIARK